MADDETRASQDEQDLTTDAEPVGEAPEADKEKEKYERLKEKLEVAVEEIGALRKKVTITIPRELIDQRLEEQYSELSRDAIVPGFRKGRAPRRLLEKRFGSEVGETLTTDLLGKGYLAAIEKVDLKVIGDPLIWCRPKKAAKGEEGEPAEKLMGVTEAFDNIELPSEGALTFACEVEIRPEFELPSLKGIPVRKPKVAITEEDLDKQVERLRGYRATWHSVPDGAVEKDDVISASLKMLADGKVVKENDSAMLAARAQSIEGVVFEDFGERIAGARAGETRKLAGTVPSDSDDAELRGKPVEFELTVKEIQRREMPAASDEFAQQMGFENLNELRDFCRRDMEAQLDQVVRRGMHGQIYKHLMDSTKFDLPERLSQRQTNRVVVRRMLDLYRQGVPEAEVAKQLDELKTTAREEAARDLKRNLIMEKIAEELKPTVTEDEVNGAIAAIAQRQNRRFDRVRDELMKNDGIESLYIAIRDDKIVDALLKEASITETEGPGGETNDAAGQADAT